MTPYGDDKIVCRSGNKYWYKDGELHRDDGPAVEWKDGYKEYWYLGCHYSKRQYKKKLRAVADTIYKQQATIANSASMIIAGAQGVDEATLFSAILQISKQLPPAKRDTLANKIGRAAHYASREDIDVRRCTLRP